VMVLSVRVGGVLGGPCFEQRRLLLTVVMRGNMAWFRIFYIRCHTNERDKGPLD
jgi:hypothetical protein